MDYVDTSKMSDIETISLVVSSVEDGIYRTENKNLPSTTRIGLTNDTVIELVSVVPIFPSKGPEPNPISRDQLISLFNDFEFLGEIYDFITERYPEIRCDRITGKEAVIFYCTKLTIAIVKYPVKESNNDMEQPRILH